MIAPASDKLAAEFGITNTAVIALTTSVFVLAYGARSPASCTVHTLNPHSSIWPVIFGSAERDLRTVAGPADSQHVVLRFVASFCVYTMHLTPSSSVEPRLWVRAEQGPTHRFPLSCWTGWERSAIRTSLFIVTAPMLSHACARSVEVCSATAGGPKSVDRLSRYTRSRRSWAPSSAPSLAHGLQSDRLGVGWCVGRLISGVMAVSPVCSQFWSTTIADGIVQILGLFFLQESASLPSFFSRPGPADMT